MVTRAKHLLASVGPEWLLEKLVDVKGLAANLPDVENGWNPAHRAAYFGNLLALRSLYESHRHLFDMTDLCGATPIDLLISNTVEHLPRIQFLSRREGRVCKGRGRLSSM